MPMGLHLGLRLDSGRVLGGAFTPASLFTGGIQGAFYDPSDLSSMFQDSGGITPATVNNPVGRLSDKSGNGNHATQATTAAKPTYMVAASKNFLRFDGIDDVLNYVVPLSVVSDFTIVAAMIARHPVQGGAGAFGFSTSGGAGAMVVYDNDAFSGSTGGIQLFYGTNTAVENAGNVEGISRVVTIRAINGTQTVRVNGVAKPGGSALATYSGTVQGLIGSGVVNGQFSQYDLHGFAVVQGALTAQQTTDSEAYMTTRLP